MRNVVDAKTRQHTRLPCKRRVYQFTQLSENLEHNYVRTIYELFGRVEYRYSALRTIHNECRADISSGWEGGGLEILKRRSDISILVEFSSGHFRSKEEGRGKQISKIEMSDGH